MWKDFRKAVLYGTSVHLTEVGYLSFPLEDVGAGHSQTLGLRASNTQTLFGMLGHAWGVGMACCEVK